MAIWFPISAFVTLGLEHSVANMFIIPAGIFAGANVSWSAFLCDNLLPVTWLREADRFPKSPRIEWESKGNSFYFLVVP